MRRALGWRERHLSENAERVQALAEELVNRMDVLTRYGLDGEAVEAAARSALAAPDRPVVLAVLASNRG